MDKLGGTYRVLLLHHANMGVNSRGARRDRTLYPPPPAPGIWPESAGPWAPKAP